MARWARHGAGIGIIVVGFCAASQFRVDRPNKIERTGKRDTQPAQFLPTDITLQLAPSPNALSARHEAVVPPSSNSERGTYGAARSGLSGLQPPPELPTDYQTFERVTPTGGSNEMLTQHPSAQRLTHKIIDGDSLEKLAERYLHDADRWPELLAANADVLTSSDLLPVNTVIAIPQRQLEDHPASGVSLEQEADDDALVPVRDH